MLQGLAANTSQLNAYRPGEIDNLFNIFHELIRLKQSNLVDATKYNQAVEEYAQAVKDFLSIKD